VTDNLHQSLISALSKLNGKFHDDPASLHYAVSIAFSSILKKHGLPCAIVGGQAAAYWMRLPGSTDVDFVSQHSNEIANVLEQCGFKRSNNFTFRFTHSATNVLIELVGERIDIAGIKSPATVAVMPNDIHDPLVRSLMTGPAEMIDPVLVFVNYIEASTQDSVWFNYEDEGALAIERAQALLVLYKEYILKGLMKLYEAGEIPEKCLQLLRDKFKIVI
jgi:hypothetical protein